MNTHEFQAKTILKKYGIPVPEHAVIHNLTEVEKVIVYLLIFDSILCKTFIFVACMF